MGQQLNQVPPNLDVWEVGGKTYLVRMNDRVSPPIPMIWEVTGEDRTALGIKKVDRKFGSWDEFYKTGALNFGNSRELVNTKEDPVETIYSNYESEVRVKPWLADREILTLWMQAALEGRSISDAELQGSTWWRTHSDTERQWISLNASDPATANALIADNRIRVADLLRAAGIDDASPALAQTIADKWTQGSWTEAYATTQIRLLADPHAGGTLDDALKSFRGGDTTREGEDQVKDLISEWLGPAHSSTWSKANIDSWAGKLRNDPDAKLELEDSLRKHRLALFPEYDNPNLTYEDIAAPWRGVFSQVWGQTPDETDALFAKVVRMNDLAGAEKLLRGEGLKRNNQTVTQNLLSDLNGAFGGQVRKADASIV